MGGHLAKCARIIVFFSRWDHAYEAAENMIFFIFPLPDGATYMLDGGRALTLFGDLENFQLWHPGLFGFRGG